MIEKKRKRIFEIIQIGNTIDIPSKAFDMFIAATIFINIAVLFLETFDEMSYLYNSLRKIEYITIAIFCIEYILRLWTAKYLYENENGLKAVLRFIISYDGIIDLLTILPFFFLSGFVVFRMLRVARIFHLFRLNKKYDSFNIITEVFKEKKSQILSSLFIILILMFASSLCMYSAEHDVQPENFKNAFSGIWWSMSTLLTVGYGDIYPITTIGKFMAIIIAFLGVGVVAIPTGIISAGFVEQYTKIKNISLYSEETNMKFVTLLVTDKHSWCNTLVKDTNLPQGLILSLILRNGEIIVPKGDILIKSGDKVIIGASGFIDEIGVELKEIVIKEHNFWINKAIKDLDISRQTIILMIKRNNKVIVPNGSTVIKQGDIIVLYSKHHFIDEKEILL